jgi:hypothetical protein
MTLASESTAAFDDAEIEATEEVLITNGMRIVREGEHIIMYVRTYNETIGVPLTTGAMRRLRAVLGEELERRER